jgi:3-hydroxyisobutyrate dehydrogenase-like beta-hydroxyacid dehydrogenase
MELTMQTLSAGKVKLGFIGLGAMGSRLALRLLSQGYEMAVYNRDRKKAAALSPHGVSVAESPAELAGKVDVLLSCLSNDQAVREIYTAPEGALAGARRGTVVLELSTVSPQTSRELHRLGADRGVEVLDAAISGSTLAVEHGTVVLLILAARFFLMGPTGSGTAMKLVVNTLLGVGMQAIAEAVVLGEAESLDRHRLLEVLSQTAVVAPAHVGKLAAAERNDYAAQFAVGLMNKDFQLILKAANAQKIAMPATEASFAVNSSAMASYPEADFSSVIRHMESLAKLNVSK